MQIRRATATLALFGALLGASACGGGQVTEIVLVVQSELDPAAMDELVIEAARADGSMREAKRADLNERSLPLSTTLVHRGGELGPLDVRIRGLKQDQPVITRRLAPTFQKNERLRLVVTLTPACTGSDAPSCGPGETCARGRCRAAAVEPCEYEGPPMCTDAGVPDAGPMDAGVDAGPCGGCTAPLVCEPQSGSCVECFENAHCMAPRADGGTDAGGTDAGGTDAGTDGGVSIAESYCDPAENQCFECLENVHCTDPRAPRCEDHQCVPCTEDSECDGITTDGTDLGVCDTGGDGPAECVECTGTDFDACEGVCDSRARTCTSRPEGEAGLCQPCVSDAECSEGKLCVPMTFGDPAQEVGTFCLWKQDSEVSGAPGGACSTVRPYIEGVESTSLDGTRATVCSLALTTCPGINDFRSQYCPAPGANAACGAQGFDDAFCVELDSATDRCTVPCGSNDDCPDPPGGSEFTCNTSQGLCEL